MKSTLPPKISVIIPVFNRITLISKAIESVIAQTFNEWELIVVDDCSTDNTYQFLCDKYKNDNRISIVQTPKNSGQGSARNFGIQLCNAPFIAFLDSDDIWHPKKLDHQYSLFSSNDNTLGMVYCGGILVDENGTKGEIKPYLRGWIEESLFVNLKGLGSSNSGIMIRKEVVEKVGMYNTKLPSQADLDFFVRIARHYRIDFIDDYYTIIYSGNSVKRISNNRKSVITGEYQFFINHAKRLKELKLYHYVARKLARKYALYAKDLPKSFCILYKAIKYRPNYIYAYIYIFKILFLYLKR